MATSDAERDAQRHLLTRAELPDEFTAEAIRALPLSTLRRLADHRNGVLGAEEQRIFDEVLREVMRGTADRVSRRLGGTDWANVGRGERPGGNRTGRPSSRADEHLRRLAQRIGQQVDVAETLAPSVDWSFAQPGATTSDGPATPPARTGAAGSPDPVVDGNGTVADLEQRLTEQVELVEVMAEIAEVGRRTYALEQQRDLQTTRGVFFGFVVSVAVLVGGWAPLVTADGWEQRGWIIGLALGTCLVAGAVYWLVRRSQNRPRPTDADPADAA